MKILPYIIGSSEYCNDDSVGLQRFSETDDEGTVLGHGRRTGILFLARGPLGTSKLFILNTPLHFAEVYLMLYNFQMRSLVKMMTQPVCSVERTIRQGGTLGPALYQPYQR